jgi:hypothetical protein
MDADFPFASVRVDLRFRKQKGEHMRGIPIMTPGQVLSVQVWSKHFNKQQTPGARTFSIELSPAIKKPGSHSALAWSGFAK